MDDVISTINCTINAHEAELYIVRAALSDKTTKRTRHEWADLEALECRISENLWQLKRIGETYDRS